VADRHAGQERRKNQRHEPESVKFQHGCGSP
jgi:hypothetical protein